MINERSKLWLFFCRYQPIIVEPDENLILGEKFNLKKSVTKKGNKNLFNQFENKKNAV